MSDDHALDRLHATLLTRRAADPGESYTAKLLAKGPAVLAKKLGEEGVEAALAGACGSAEDLVAESADLLYHLTALWIARDVAPDAVWAELERRTGQSGLAEKAARPKNRDSKTEE
ncbi:MAG: phosphoribosyl-ATP diphosphatase [Rhodospirillales bacterium]